MQSKSRDGAITKSPRGIDYNPVLHVSIRCSIGDSVNRICMS